MAFATKAILDSLMTMVTALPGIQEVYRGVPSGFEKKVVAFVAMGPRELVDKATNLLARDMQFLIIFGVRVDEDEDTAEAEDVLADIEDALIEAWKNDRKLGGVVESSYPEDRSGDPEYRIMLGEEFRVRAYHMRTRQYDTFPTGGS